ncbi:hypothetical protein [Bacteroides sp.]|uniref:hypothetical protein n=1 Tax=Bacteroides sp. TaxID=29523 RepID=UPI002626323D|nr:hypothetical protein [Bacteroides sp.]MDD3037808.1 hypothetical protein [Bacteroides sp.]
MRNTMFKMEVILCLLGTFMLYSINVTANVQKEDLFPIKITFDQPGALYHAKEKGTVFIQVEDSCREVTLELLDTDRKILSRKSYFMNEKDNSTIYYPLKQKNLGYYTLKVIATSATKTDTLEQGFGIIPNVTLTKKDWDSPFGICGHYTRYDYKKWKIGAVQQKLGIAWVRDESNWKKVVEDGLKSDPDLDYLDSHHICWLNLFGYINSFDGVQNEKNIWTWDEDISILKKYVELTKGHFSVFESQNEPNNFGGWSKRWPHPEGQQWRPQGWGKPFADLIKQMSDSIRTIDSSIQLMWQGEGEWIEYFVNERGAASYIDVIAIHPYVNQKRYPETERFASGYYNENKSKLREMKVPTEMWVTEVGWSTFKSNGEPNHYVPVTEYEQAAYLVRTYLLHLYYGAKKVFWYEIADEPFGFHNPESFFGILRFNESLSVKPSGIAYSNMINNYRYATPIGKYIGSTYGFAYDNKGKTQMCLWVEKESKEETLHLQHTKKIIVTDIFGRVQKMKVVDGKIVITVGYLPVTITGINKTDFEELYTPRIVVE